MKIGTSTVTAIYLGTTSIVSAYLGATQVFGGTSVFTPLDLFSGGSQGIWLDPSDLSTMFSDRAGTTPVTTPGTVVGLRLDKSKGGDQSLPTTGWTVNSGDGVVTIADNVITITGATTTTRVDINSPGWVIGDYAKITVNASIGSATGATIFVGGGAPSGISAGSRTYVAVISSSTLTRVQISSGSATFTVTARSKTSGNHAVAPTDAARPIYGVEPKGGRRNLLTWSEDFGNAVWVKANVTVPATQYLAPDGTTTAELLYPTSSGTNRFVYQALSSASNIYTGSVYAKASGKNFLCLDITGGGASAYFDLSAGTVGTVSAGYTASIQSVGSGWHRCSIRNTSNAALSFAGVYSVTDADNSRTVTANGTDGILLWGAQLELGSTATNYQRVTTAYDITESGVATCHYVQYDGSDDSMSTAAIDFTATDKMSVFAGVRKLSDATAALLLELSADYNANTGSFFITAPENTAAAGNYGSASRGAAAANANQTAKSAVLLAPISSVLAVTNNIAGDLSAIRVNGAASGTNGTFDKGTGNFGNYPLFIGRRNNATLPFNGRDFGIIIVGKTASAGEITDTETWLAAKTSGVTL